MIRSLLSALGALLGGLLIYLLIPALVVTLRDRSSGAASLDTPAYAALGVLAA